MIYYIFPQQSPRQESYHVKKEPFMQVTQIIHGAGASWVCSVHACPFTYHGARPSCQTHWTRWSSQCQLQQKEKHCSVGVSASLLQQDRATIVPPATRSLRALRTTNPWSNVHTLSEFTQERPTCCPTNSLLHPQMGQAPRGCTSWLRGHTDLHPVRL